MYVYTHTRCLRCRVRRSSFYDYCHTVSSARPRIFPGTEFERSGGHALQLHEQPHTARSGMHAPHSHSLSHTHTNYMYIKHLQWETAAAPFPFPRDHSPLQSTRIRVCMCMHRAILPNTDKHTAERTHSDALDWRDMAHTPALYTSGTTISQRIAERTART